MVITRYTSEQYGDQLHKLRYNNMVGFLTLNKTEIQEELWAVIGIRVLLVNQNSLC
jgi:hypothetical protein